jgi:hypothetical protein
VNLLSLLAIHISSQKNLAVATTVIVAIVLYSSFVGIESRQARFRAFVGIASDNGVGMVGIDHSNQSVATVDFCSTQLSTELIIEILNVGKVAKIRRVNVQSQRLASELSKAFPELSAKLHLCDSIRSSSNNIAPTDTSPTEQ